jgi:hypothetical protein
VDYGRVFARMGLNEHPCEFDLTEEGIKIEAQRIEGSYSWSAEAEWIYESDVTVDAGPNGAVLRIGFGLEVRFVDLTASQIQDLIEPYRSILGSGLTKRENLLPLENPGEIDETIRQLPREEVDEESAEEWIRETGEPEVRNVCANKGLDGEWDVSIWAAEFVREEPLESRMGQMLLEALQSVPGVAEVWHEDREVWHVTGSPGGEDLTGAAALVIDSLADEIRPHVNG